MAIFLYDIVDNKMAKETEVQIGSKTVLTTRPLSMEEERKSQPNSTGGSMEIDILDLGSLSLKDDLDVADHCQSSNVTGMDTCESGIEADDFRSLIDRQTEDKNTDNVRFQSCSVYNSIDEGYNSKSIPARFSVQETEDNRLVSSMMSFDPMLVYSQDKDGDTDLHNGIIQRMVSFVMLFISAAPNSEWLNIVNLRLQTPLHLSVITEQVNVVRRLMTAGARVDVADLHGNTPLHIACREGYVDIVQCLLRPVFYEETHLNKYDIPYQRIPQDLNRRNSDGHTCLHLAAMSTHLKVLELLLSKGADINSGDGTSGRTVLHYAAETGNRILLHFLLSQRKINISCRTYGGLTPLRLAAGRGYGDVVTILLAHGADVTDIDESDDDVIDDFRINGQPITV